jgi:hypothetical protein
VTAIVFPVSSAPGREPQEGSGRLVNCYAVKTEQGNRSPFKWPRSAGAREILNIVDHTHCRGMIPAGSTLLVVLDERVYAVTESGDVFTATNLGALSGSDTVTIAKNQAATPNIAVVCDAGTFNLFTGSAPSSFADGDWPSVNSITSSGGYLIGTTGSGEIWATDLNAVTVESVSFVSAQMPLRRGVYFRGELFAMGERSIKVYEETGESPFPFRYKKIEIPRGICGTHAVAGYEEGWVGELFWVGEDSIVYQLVGYTPTPVSNEDVVRAIASAADRTLIEASVYMDGQNAFVSITSPGEWTWEFNVTTRLWNERTSKGRDDWRARRSVRAFDRWIVGDDTTGKLASIDPMYRFEYGDPLVATMVSGDNAKFPYRVTVGAAYFDFVVGQGSAPGADPIETDPVCMIRVSLDGGATWGNQLLRKLGKQGQYGTQVSVSRCGTTRGGKGIRFEVSVSDPVIATFLGGDMPDVEARAA